MKPRVILFTIFLMVLFSLKMGTGLLLHQLFHASAGNGHEIPVKGSDLSFACNCVDDFLMPFTGSDEPTISIATTYQEQFFPIPDSPVLITATIFYSLRAPPSVLS